MEKKPWMVKALIEHLLAWVAFIGYVLWTILWAFTYALMGGWGGTRTVVSGREKREVAVDEEYVRRSIYDPNADVADGFGKGLMLSYEGMVSEEEVKLIIEYLKELNE